MSNSIPQLRYFTNSFNYRNKDPSQIEPRCPTQIMPMAKGVLHSVKIDILFLFLFLFM
jgi:hypothetical protein